MSDLRRFPFVRTGWPDHCWTSHLASEIGLFQRVFAKTPSPSCELFRIWLIWLDSFDYKWNSHHDWKGLASQFWQMESTLREVSVSKRVEEKDYSGSICSSRCLFQWGRSVCYVVMPIINHNQSLTKIFKQCYNWLWKNVKWIIARSENFFRLICKK